jgi:hypothetical protein
MANPFMPPDSDGKSAKSGGEGSGSEDLPNSQNSYIMDKFRDKVCEEWQPTLLRSASWWTRPLRTALAARWENMLASHHNPRCLQVEEGCAGLASAHLVFKCLEIPCSGGTTSDLKPHARTFIENNFEGSIEHMFASMYEHARGCGHDFLQGRTIDIHEKQVVDVLLIGPPCQPFSSQRADRNMKKSREHELFKATFGDGILLEDGGSAIDLIRRRLPGTFIIEQVTTFCKSDAEGFHPAAAFIKEIEQITKDGAAFYEAFHIFNMSPEIWLTMSRPRTVVAAEALQHDMPILALDFNKSRST